MDLQRASNDASSQQNQPGCCFNLFPAPQVKPASHAAPRKWRGNSRQKGLHSA